MSIAHYRRMHDLRQKDLAGLLDVDQSAVSNWERGQRPLKKYVDKMVQLFGCTEAELLSEKADNDCALAPGGGDNG